MVTFLPNVKGLNKTQPLYIFFKSTVYVPGRIVNLRGEVSLMVSLGARETIPTTHATQAMAINNYKPLNNHHIYT